MTTTVLGQRRGSVVGVLCRLRQQFEFDLFQPKAHDWDDHAVNWDMPTAMLARLPRYDHVVTTLIEDLFDRGLDKKVLLIVTGEFGRTPRLEFKDGRIGRDHYPGAMSILVSGGNMPMGQVIDQLKRRPLS